MSHIIAMDTHIQHAKDLSIMAHINDTVYQGWIHIYGLLFWIASAVMNHWELKSKKPSPIPITEPSQPKKPKMKSRKSSLSKEKIPTVSKSSPSTLQRVPLIKITENQCIQRENKTKQSLLLMKSHMKTWKQKLSSSPPSSPIEENIPASPKRSLLRRLSSANNTIQTEESISPSKLKSFSFKLKRQDSSDMCMEKNSNGRRLSLSSFRRKSSSSDITI